MKKYQSILAVLVLALCVGITQAHAETENKIEAKNNISLSADAEVKLQADMKEKREFMRKEAEDKRGELRLKWDALKGEMRSETDAAKAKLFEGRITLREKVMVRFDQVVDNLTNIKERIEVKIDNLEDKGVTSAKAESSIELAEDNLVKIDVKIASINEIFAKSSNEMTASEKETVRTLAKEIQDLIKETRQALHDALTALKDEVRVKMQADITAEANADAKVNQ